MTALSEKWFEKNPWARGREFVSSGDGTVGYAQTMSMVMDAVMPDRLFCVRDESERPFSRRGVQIKALVYVVWMSCVGVLSYFFYDFDVDTKTEEQKMLSFLVMICIPVWLLLPMWLNKRYTTWAFVLARVNDFLLFTSLGWLIAGAVLSRPYAVPVVVCVGIVAVLCVVCAGVLLAGVAVMSFMGGDMKTVNCLAEVHRVHKRYEWAVAYVLVFDVVARVAGLAKASSQRNV